MVTHPSREIVCGDAFAWLETHPARAGMSVVTSLPDVSELPGMTTDTWREWCSETARLIIEWLPEAGLAVFFQSDIRCGPVWVDKGYLVARGAERANATLLWHKIACRIPPGTPTLGRASYAHLLCFARRPPSRSPSHASPDVLPDAGAKSWSRAMGSVACELACRYLVEETSTDTVVDPFCGHGALLAVANALGLSAIGVDLSAKRCRAARRATVEGLELGGGRHRRANDT